MAAISGVQRGSATIGNGNSTTTVTITSVDLTKSILLFNYSMVTSLTPASDTVRGQLTAGNQITFHREGTENAVSIRWEVITFSSGVTVQRGTSSFGLFIDNTNVTIGAVDLSKAVAIHSVSQFGNTADYDDLSRISLTSPTNLRISIPNTNTGVAKTCDWQVIEFADANVQSGSYAMNSSTTSVPITLSEPIDTTKTVVFNSYMTNNGAGYVPNRHAVRSLLTNSNTVTFERNVTGGTSIAGAYFVVTFTDATTVRYGTAAISLTNSGINITLNPAVDLDRSVVYAGVNGTILSGNSTSQAMAYPLHQTYLASENTLTATRSNTGNSNLLTYYVMEFPAATGTSATVDVSGVSASGSVGSVTSNIVNPPTALNALHKGSGTIDAFSDTLVVTIPPVDMSKAFLLFSINGAGSGVTAYDMVRGQITSETEVTFVRHTAHDTPINVEYQVLSFSHGVTVQRGVVGFNDAASSTLIPITEVDTSKSIVLATTTNSGSFTGADDIVRAKFNSSTEISLDRSEPGGFAAAYWQVITFANSVVSTGDYTLSGSETEKIITVPAKDLTKTIVFHSYMGGTSTSKPDYNCAMARMTSATELTISRFDSRSAALDGTWFLVEFIDNTAVQSGVLSFASGGTVATGVLSPSVSTTNTAVIGGYPYSNSYSSQASDDLFMQASATLVQSSGTSVTATRGATGSTLQQTWQAVTFEGTLDAIDANATPDGVSAGVEIGSVNVSVVINTTVAPTGVSAQSVVGTGVVTSDVNIAVSATGVSGAVSVGSATATITSAGTALVSGVSANASVGTVFSTSSVAVNLAGVSANTHVGTVAGTVSVPSVNVSVDLIGVSAATFVGGTEISNAVSCIVNLTGISATATVRNGFISREESMAGFFGTLVNVITGDGDNNFFTPNPTTSSQVSGDVGFFDGGGVSGITMTGDEALVRLDATGGGDDVDISLATKGNGVYYFWQNGFEGTPALTVDANGVSSFYGSVAAPVFMGSLNGNATSADIATTADRLTTPRLINGVPFDGTEDITFAAAEVATLTRGQYLTGANYDGNAPTTWAVDATPMNEPLKVVARDANGDFSARRISADLLGNASTATKLQAPVNINGVAFDGSSNITIADPTKLPTSGGFMTGNLGGTTFRGNTGSATAPNFSFTADTNSGMYSGGADILKFATGGTERLAINAIGEILPASTSNIIWEAPGDHYCGYRPTTANLIGNTGRQFFGIADGGGWSGVRVNNYQDGVVNSQSIEFVTHKGGVGTDTRATITAAGEFLIGRNATTTPGYAGNTSLGSASWPTGRQFISQDAFSNWNLKRAGGGTLLSFSTNGTEVGSISLTTSATVYATSSDYRLKTDIEPITAALDRLAALKPSRFRFKADPSVKVDGFIAHEVADAVPEAVIGTKDAVDEHGAPVYQGVDASKLVPLLVAALQEANTKIDTLITRIEALERGAS